MSLIYTEEATTVGGTYKKRNSVYIGGRADAKDCEKLERWNVSHILNVTPTKEASIQAGVPNFFERTRKFKYKRIQVYDAPTSSQQLLDSASAIVNFISSGLFHGSVLIHCQHGVSRSTTCCVFYLMKYVYRS
jgi:protein-tyrosine phosphatase